MDRCGNDIIECQVFHSPVVLTEGNAYKRNLFSETSLKKTVDEVKSLCKKAPPS